MVLGYGVKRVLNGLGVEAFVISCQSRRDVQGCRV